MRKIFLLCILFSLHIFNGYAQKEGRVLVDSLIARLAFAKDDTNKVKLLNRIVVVFNDENNDERAKYGEQALALSEKLKWQSGILQSKVQLGRIYWKKGNFEKALALHHDAVRIAETHNFKVNLGNIYILLGQDYGDYGKYPEALKYFNKAKSEFARTNDSLEIANTYLLLSWVYDEQGNFPQSSLQNIEALKIYESFKDDYGISIASANIAIDYNKIGRYEESISYLNKSSLGYLKQNDYVNIAGNHILIAVNYVELKKYSEALRWAAKSLDMGQKAKDHISIGNAYSKTGDIEFIQNDFSSATNHYNLAIESYRKANAVRLMAPGFSKLAMSLLRLNKIDLAKAALDSTYKFWQQGETILAPQNYYNAMQLYDSLTGNWKGAYLNYFRYITKRDSLNNSENQKSLMQIQMQYEFDKKEAIVKAEQEKKDIAQRNIRNSILAGLILVTVFLIVVFRQRNKISRAKKHSDDLNSELQLTLENLKSTQQQLIQSEKLAAFGTVATRMAHEIQNPLNFVNNFSELSEELVHEIVASKDENEKADAAKSLLENLQKINQHGKRASSIVKQLQEHSNKGTAHEFFETPSR